MVFIEVLRHGQNWAKKLILLACFMSFFGYALLHIMNYRPRFCQMKDLFKIYISVVSFISIAYGFVKLKVFKVSCIDSASMKWPLFVCLFVLCFFGFYSSKYCSILMKF